MNCLKCKYYKIKFNKDIRNSDYCTKFETPINTLKEKIKTEKLKCFEEGKNDITEFFKQCAKTYFKTSRELQEDDM